MIAVGKPDRSAPLWRQTCSEIQRRIDGGEWATEGQLPSERELVEQLGVSRITLRRALAELAGAGFLISMSGRGWFVREAVGARSDAPNVLQSLTARGKEQGWEITSLVTVQLVRASTYDEAHTLAIPPGFAVLELERVRRINGLEISIDHSLVPTDALPNGDTIDFTTASLYGSLTEHGHRPHSAVSTVSAQLATKRHAELLHCQPGSPILRIAQDTHDAQGRLVERAVTDHHGDRYRFIANRFA